jgi:hypothetical protein
MSSPQRPQALQFWLVLLLMMLGTAAAFVAPSQAQAGVVFHYDSFCTPLPCPDVGLGAGADVSGVIEFADGAIAPNAIVSREDIVGFTLDFGTIDIDFASAFGFAFEGLVDATGNGFAEFTMTTSDTFEPPGTFETSGGLLFLDVIGWAGGAGACTAADCADFFLIDGSFGLEATIARVEEPDPNPLPIPVPPAALLVVAPLATLLRSRGPNRRTSVRL